MNALVIVVGAFCVFALAYRYYAAFLAAKVAVLNEERVTPAHRLKDGVDYHPTNRWVLFGHHFAAIAGAGPLIGPVLAAQFGFLPGAVWIVIGAVFAGAVHDYIILFASVRLNGLSLANIAKTYIGGLSGFITSLAILFIMTCALAGLAMVVVGALSESSWGTFTILASIPAALITGLWMYKIRPGKIGQASAIGVTMVLLGVILGRPFEHSAWGHYLAVDPTVLKIALPVYGFIASVLPVWVLLCPRDYLSSYMKIGVIALLALGICIVHPHIQMPAVTPLIHGGGPIVPGKVWPFVCITIMCGALSGFHSLIASGTTPKMISSESDIKFIGYGAMITEGFVALMALVAATVLMPADYFHITVPVEKFAAFAQQFPQWAVPVHLKELEGLVEEHLQGRFGGSPTLAVGMAYIFSHMMGATQWMSYWYHFAIMFEALFILTTVDTGTRVARFILEEAVQSVFRLKDPRPALRWTLNIGCSAAICLCWGYLLFNNDIATIWPMFGIANQLLASIALAIGTTIILRTSEKRAYALVTFLPLIFVFITTMTAGVESIPGFAKMAAKDPFKATVNVSLTISMLALSALVTLDAAWKWILILLERIPRILDLESEEPKVALKPL